MLDIASNPTAVDRCRADDLARMTALFEEMEQALEGRLARGPRRCETLLRLAECKRKLGRVDEAVRLYGEVARREPVDGGAAYAAAALSGRLNRATPRPNGIRPAPLVHEAEFLPPELHREALRYLEAHREAFTPALVNHNGRPEIRPEVRNNIDLKGAHPIKGEIRARVAERLGAVAPRLGLEPFTPTAIEVKLRMYRDGDYFRIHHDGGAGRRVTFVYFLFAEPRPFDGGELAVFDTDPERMIHGERFTRIVPRNNTLFLFPSRYFHAVLPVRGREEGVAAVRFAANGHARAA